VVFQPGVLEKAPQTYVALVQVDSSANVALQREVATRHPNISAIDVAIVQRTLRRIVERVSLAIRFMSLFSLAAGLAVLVAALRAGRFQRLRETALLRVLGAQTKQVWLMLLTEYAALGALAATTGVLLGGAAGWLVIHYAFSIHFSLPVLSLTLLWAGTVIIALAAGSFTARGYLEGTPLEILREIGG
jgi:putative ABC transport system permease protein